MSTGNPNVVAVMSDLFFSAQIHDTAKKLGMTTTLVRDAAAALEQIQPTTVAVILDLNCASADPLSLIQTIKSSPAAAGISIVGFVSHVQADLREKAAECGCDRVITRSVFTRDLPAILETALKSTSRA